MVEVCLELIQEIQTLRHPGVILVRISGSDAEFECPLTLYSNGTASGIPSSVESTRIMESDEEATVPDGGNYIECTGCDTKLVARAQPQDLLKDWTVHKVTCKALQCVCPEFVSAVC